MKPRMPKKPSTGFYLSGTAKSQLEWLMNHFGENASKTVTRLITERYSELKSKEKYENGKT